MVEGFELFVGLLFPFWVGSGSVCVRVLGAEAWACEWSCSIHLCKAKRKPSKRKNGTKRTHLGLSGCRRARVILGAICMDLVRRLLDELLLTLRLAVDPVSLLRHA